MLVPSADEIIELILAERRRLGALLPELTAEQWSTPSLCGGWRVRDVVGHLVVAMASDRRRVGAAMLRAGGNFHRAMDREARVEADATTAELIERFDAVKESVNPPPLLGPPAPLTDIVVHTQDIAVPTGLGVAPDSAALRVALEFRTSNRLARTFGGTVPRHTRLVADDVGWEWTSGRPERTVRGPGLALLLHLTGRPARDGDLTFE